MKRRMGHEDVRTTFNLYGHRFPDREEDLVAALDRRLVAAADAKTCQVPVPGRQIGSGTRATLR